MDKILYKSTMTLEEAKGEVPCLIIKIVEGKPKSDKAYTRNKLLRQLKQKISGSAVVGHRYLTLERYLYGLAIMRSQKKRSKRIVCKWPGYWRH